MLCALYVKCFICQCTIFKFCRNKNKNCVKPTTKNAHQVDHLMDLNFKQKKFKLKSLDTQRVVQLFPLQIVK